MSYSSDEVWQANFELAELVLAGCPDAALKAFRKSIIGRGPNRRLSAKQADAAIGGATKALALEVFERPVGAFPRLTWYGDKGITPIVAHSGSQGFTGLDDCERWIELAWTETDVVRIEHGSDDLLLSL